MEITIMNIKSFKQMHTNAMGIGEAQGKLNQQLADTYRNETDRADYLNWLTATARDDSQGRMVQDKFALEIKAVQKNINLANTQKLMVNGSLTKESPEDKVRLLRANIPLLNAGKVTQKDIDNKQYFFIVTPNEPASEVSDDKKVGNFMTKNNFSKKQMLKILAKLP
tara:strand:- start:141 stop:641 length:501 start_codon:yes stop_codon:yes gene_type:complete